ncbi:Kelch repeat-containing protein [Mesoterricola silvestris]|uniref:Uncharacterized protein n=1 Tax=Mesoterricola silvestris TaxID=2927979 RepID=A0AA48GNC1_9BACT|nr:hypothetical protein [Mesoterricola silvestris]BDU73034.1 hypothetical protein METEAL_22080 [Mesoterricola silvestris]
MVLGTALSLALVLAPGAVKPRTPKPSRTAAPKPDPSVPAPGSFAERVDPATGRGRAVGPFLEPRTDFQATSMPDGRVLITGGSLKGPTSEWFDPATNRFTLGPALTRVRQGHRALALKDGRVLVLGGTEAPAPAEVLDPGGTAFRALPDAAFSLSADAVELEDRVLLVDGASGSVYTWDGRKGPSSKGVLARPRVFFRLVRLKDGRVAITGGWASEQKVRGRRTPSGPSLPVEVFNPRWSTLSTWSQVPQPRARHQAALLADGRVCLWAGVGADPDVPVADMEILDPAKETVTRGPALDLQGLGSPAWAGGFYLPERGRRLLVCADPLALPGAAPGPRLANGYLGPVLVPLRDGGVLVLGAPAFGDPLDRWDPRSRQTAVVGTLREGTASLGLLPDGRVLALGDVVDLVDPRTGSLSPLGWREDLKPLLATLRPVPSAPEVKDRPGAAVVPLDRARALVIGGGSPDAPSGTVEFLDLKKKTLTPAGSMKIRRPRPAGLKLNDGSVLVWGTGKE